MERLGTLLKFPIAKPRSEEATAPVIFSSKFGIGNGPALITAMGGCPRPSAPFGPSALE